MRTLEDDLETIVHNLSIDLQKTDKTIDLMQSFLQEQYTERNHIKQELNRSRHLLRQLKNTPS